MMPMFLTVYLSNNEQHFSEVPITPETLCADVLELCREPGDSSCYLAEVWRGSERAMGDSEKMMDLLMHWGQTRPEVRFFLRHGRASDSRLQSQKRNTGKKPSDRRAENGVSGPRTDLTLAELQEMAAKQQRQIDSQQQLLASKEQRVALLRQQEHRHQQARSEQQKLQHLRSAVEKQEEQLKAVRALKGQVEQKRISNGKLGEQVEQMNGLLLQKQKELVVAVSRVEDLSKQLESLKHGPMDALHRDPSSGAELDRLYRDLQMRKNMNLEQNTRLQQQRENLNKRNHEVANMDRRVNELRDRLWKKKAALQQKENLPCPPDGQPAPPTGVSRVAAVGPYIQSSTMPRGSSKQDLLLKQPYPEGSATVPHQEKSTHPAAANSLMPGRSRRESGISTGLHSAKASSKSSNNAKSLISNGSTSLPRLLTQASNNPDKTELQKRDPRVRPASMFESIEAPAASLRKNQSSEDLARDAQIAVKNTVKVPPPVPSKPKQASLPKTGLNAGTFPGKSKSPQQPPTGSQHALPQGGTLPLPSKPEAPPAATVHPFSPDPPKEALLKPQMLAASSIYNMYTQQSVTGALGRAQTRSSNFTSVYGKPVTSSQNQLPENPYLDPPSVPETEKDHSPAPETQEPERIPRPLSPTKLLPFITNPYRHQSDVDLEALRKRLYNAPRPLKKRSSITEPEGPGGPNIQKLLYQKTTLAAMETTASPAGDEEKEPPAGAEGASLQGPKPAETEAENVPPPPPPLPAHPAQQPHAAVSPPTQQPHAAVSPPTQQPHAAISSPPPPPASPPPPPPPPPAESLIEDFPPYPPPPYPSGAEQEPPEDTFSMKPPEVTGQVRFPPGKRTNLRKSGSERIEHSMRVHFNPLALLLDSSLEGELDLVQRIIHEVEDPSQPNDEGITALHNAVCAGHTEIVRFLVQYGVSVNAADSDGWTPLHCAASCNNVSVCKFLVESGAAVFAMTYSDMQTAADKCEEMEEGYTQCSQFLYGVQEKMGIMNRGVVYGLWEYESEQEDELSFSEGDSMSVSRREDEDETEWWWVRMGNREGYAPRNLLGLYPRIKPRHRSLA